MQTKNYIHMILLALVMLTVCNGKAQTLSEISARLNKSCPIDKGMVSINRTSFSGNTFSLYIAYADGQLSFDSLRVKPKTGEELAAFFVGLMYKSYPYMFTRMLSKNVPFRLLVSEKYGDDHYSVTLPPNKIKAAIRKYADLSIDMIILEKELIYGQCIKDVLKVILHPDCLEYQFAFDDSFLTDDNLENYKEELRKSIKANMMTRRDQSTVVNLTALKHTHKNLKYTYVGTSGRIISVVLDQDDLNDLMTK